MIRLVRHQYLLSI